MDVPEGEAMRFLAECTSLPTLRWCGEWAVADLSANLVFNLPSVRLLDNEGNIPVLAVMSNILAPAAQRLLLRGPLAPLNLDIMRDPLHLAGWFPSIRTLAIIETSSSNQNWGNFVSTHPLVAIVVIDCSHMDSLDAIISVFWMLARSSPSIGRDASRSYSPVNCPNLKVLAVLNVPHFH